MKTGMFLLEFMVYLAISSLIVMFGCMCVVHMITLNQKLERCIGAECALYNALTLFRRDCEYMPQNLGLYIDLQPTRISWRVTPHETITWYFDNNRLMRAHHDDQGWEYAVVLEPINQGTFVPNIQHQQIISLTIQLTHNDKIYSHTLWPTKDLEPRTLK